MMTTKALDPVATEDGEDRGRYPAAERFAVAMTMQNLFIVQASQLALSKASSPDLRSLSDEMIESHTELDEALRSAAIRQLSLPLPQQLDGRHRQVLSDLQEAEGAEFDRQFAACQAEAHGQIISLLQLYIAEGPEGPLHEVASTSGRVIEAHHETLRKLSASS